MKLSIIVPHYKEPWKTVEPLFDSLKEQLGFDLKELEVIVVHDGTDKWTYLEKYPMEYPFSVSQIEMEHGGVSKARNTGLENAKGDYVMFCDCDDRFISAYGLYMFSKAFGQFDIIRTPFLEDQVIDGELKLIRHDGDITFVHGKAYRRKFLIENELKFNEELTIHEDGYFNVLAHTLAKTSVHEMQPAVYLWKYNDDSVVRRDRDLYLYKTYDHLMNCRIAICRELWRRECIVEYFQSVAKSVIDAYYDFQKPDALKPENKEIVKSAEKEFARYYKEFKDDYNDIGVNDIAQMMMVCRAIGFQNGMRIEQETLSQFVTRIVKEYL